LFWEGNKISIGDKKVDINRWYLSDGKN